MFLRMAWRARAVHAHVSQLRRVKERLVLAHLRNQPPEPTTSEELHRLWARLRERLLGVVPCVGPAERFLADVRDEYTLTHFVAKSLAGFLGAPAAVVHALLAVVLTLGLAFSARVRCFVLLLLPQLCSSRGRQALLAYALILTLAGPAANALRNARVLADSLRCGQDRMRGAARRVLDLVAQPLRVLSEAVKRVLRSIKQAVRTIRDMLLSVKRAVMAVYHAVKAAFSWLSEVVSVCNKTVGTPFQKCMRAFDQASSDCMATMGSAFSWMCSPVTAIQAVCFTVKFLDYMCDLFDLVTNAVVESVKKKLRAFGRHVQRALYVSVDIEHSFELQTNRSKTLTQVAKDIGQDIRDRSDALLGAFGFINSALSLCFLVVLLRVWLYRYKFLTRDHFDNRFVTKAFRQLDWNRARQGRETVLPLTIKEQNKYITIWTPRLAGMERVRLARSLGVVLSHAAKMAMFLLADFFLYWILAIVYRHGQFKAHVDMPPHLGVRVYGDGVIARLYRSVIDTFKPSDEKWEVDSVPCLPRPFPPDFVRYVQIMTIPLLCLALAFLEPYVLRVRQAVMCHYHPERAQERAVWLYNHVLRARNTLAKMLRRQLRRLLEANQDQRGVERITCLEWLRASAGQYCATCYSELGRLCTACKMPVDYGDVSDISDEP
ncbi:DC-STAMP domain-containing protein 2-like [Thrips palmi]|uniref:DC-STAMP domain-containing protein 2-like n=1 Tax=Thrips palmi TaxID=161013 RepID=A0A6P8YZK8_THRPL|nr:DC-STAMP domain-containing protein 2-like [Thrips palmi]